MLRIIILILTIGSISYADDQESIELTKLSNRIDPIEVNLKNLENTQSHNEVKVGSRLDRIEESLEKNAFILFISATLCSLWAMYTRRSSVLWFFLGGLLAPFALIALLIKSSSDLNSGRMNYWD